MGRIFKKIKSFLLKIDIFASKELLRYKGEGSFQTLTGGIVTLILIAIFIIIFSQNLKRLIGK